MYVVGTHHFKYLSTCGKEIPGYVPQDMRLARRKWFKPDFVVWEPACASGLSHQRLYYLLTVELEV